MNMKRWLIAAVTLTFALSTAGAVTAFALTANGGGDNPEVPNGTESAGEVLHGDPTYEQWLSDFGDQTVVTSIDDIDSNVCNLVHNLNACTPEELEELGVAPITDSIAVGESVDEPEPRYESQSHKEAVEQDCGLAGGTVYVSSSGEVGCVIVHDLEHGGDRETQAQPPLVAPKPKVLTAG